MPTLPRLATSGALLVILSLATSAWAVTPTDTGGKTGEPPAVGVSKNEPPGKEPPKNPPVKEKPREGERNVDEIVKKKPGPKKPKVIYVPREPDVPVYPVPVKHYCPAGLQPVTVSGTISCGRPNTSVTYRSMMAHPAPKHPRKKVVRRRSATAHCNVVGVKGCIDR